MESMVVTPIAPPVSAEFGKLTFRSLYTPRTGPGRREISMDGKSDLGKRYFSDFPVYDGPGSDAKLVARVSKLDQGRSTLLANGVITGGSDEWAIYGGTGAFAMAKGVIKRKHIGCNGGESDELTMDVFLPAFGSSQQTKRSVTTMAGLWGGEGGSDQELTVVPKRLQSFTIRVDGCIDAIEFTYIDKTGEKHTAGPWGGPGGIGLPLSFEK